MVFDRDGILEFQDLWKGCHFRLAGVGIPGTSDRVALERKRGNTGFSCPHLQDRFLSAGA